MPPLITATHFDLAPGCARRIALPPGTELRVLRGRVWLTVSHRAEDWFLCAGSRRRLLDDGDWVIEALSEAAQVEVHRPVAWCWGWLAVARRWGVGRRGGAVAKA